MLLGLSHTVPPLQPSTALRCPCSLRQQEPAQLHTHLGPGALTPGRSERGGVDGGKSPPKASSSSTHLSFGPEIIFIDPLDFGHCVRLLVHRALGEAKAAQVSSRH